MIEKGCKVGFFGLGRSNIALLSSLPLQKCELTLRDDKIIDRASLPLKAWNRILLGDDCCKDIDEDIIFFSPSVRRDRPELEAARARGVIFSSDAELFFEENKTPVLAVTGSDGKSTTATLIHLLLCESGKRSKLIGNIGTPFIESVREKKEYYVCELSSFMLKYIKPESLSACITNITENHLDWHEDLKEYIECKKNVLTNAGRIVLSEENAGLATADVIISTDNYKRLIDKYGERLYITFENQCICRNGRKILDLKDILRKEIHNIKNLMMAIAMTDGLVSDEAILSVAKTFDGLKHRCEALGKVYGVECFNSSIDSSPARCAQTLRSLEREVVIILGGRGKGLDYRSLLPDGRRWIKQAIICGENADEIFRAISPDIKCEIYRDFNEAVKRGLRCAMDVGTLLLSPASTSYDRFKNYAERGDRFKEILKEISDNENKSLQNIEEMRNLSETDLS